MIRGAGNAARILGGISLIANLIFHGALLFLAISAVLVVLGQVVYQKPTRDKKPHVIGIMVVSVLGFIASAAIGSYPVLIAALAVYAGYTIVTINRKENEKVEVIESKETA